MVLKRAERASLPTYFYHSLPEHDASSDVRHVALNTAFDAYAKSECIAGGVPWSLVRPQPCSSWPPREAQTRLDSVRDQPPQSRRLVVAIESDRAETRSERESSVARCRELPRDRAQPPCPRGKGLHKLWPKGVGLWREGTWRARSRLTERPQTRQNHPLGRCAWFCAVGPDPAVACSPAGVPLHVARRWTAATGRQPAQEGGDEAGYSCSKLADQHANTGERCACCSSTDWRTGGALVRASDVAAAARCSVESPANRLCCTFLARACGMRGPLLGE